MKKKNKVIYICILLLLLIMIILCMTYAYFNLVLTQKEDDTKIYSGSLAIDYIDGDVISDIRLRPVINPSLDNSYGAYIKNFKVYPSGNFNQSLNIYLKITRNTFSHNALNYILYNNQNIKVSTGTIPEDGELLIAENIFLEKGIEKEFNLMIWLEESGENQNKEQAKDLKAKIELKGTQVVE